MRALYAIPTEALPAFDPLLDAGAVRIVQDAVAAVTVANQPPAIDLGRRVHQVENELGMTLGQVVALPLLFEDDFLGLIYLFRGDYAFSQLDWQFLQGFADQAAIAVRNARLYSLLRAESSRLITILENSADGIMILTRDRIVVAINHTLAAMVGIALEDAVGRPCSAVLPLENVAGADFCRDESYTGQFSTDNLRCEGELIRPGDKHLALAVTFTPLYAENGRLINIIVNVHDITRFREEEEMKSTFTSIISHELKTPVALIKGYAQTLARPDAQWDAETARAGLQIIEEEADRLESLINNLLDASRIQAKGLRLDLADVNLGAAYTRWRTPIARRPTITASRLRLTIRCRQSGAMKSACVRSLPICSTMPSNIRHKGERLPSAAGFVRRRMPAARRNQTRRNQNSRRRLPPKTLWSSIFPTRASAFPRRICPKCSTATIAWTARCAVRLPAPGWVSICPR